MSSGTLIVTYHSVATRHAKAVEARRVAHGAVGSPAYTASIRRPTRVGNTVATCTALSKRVVERILASATTVDQETTVGNVTTIGTRLVKHGCLRLGEGMQAIATSINLSATVWPTRTVGTFLVKLRIAQCQAVAALVVAEVGERNPVATKARLTVASADATDVKDETAVGVTITARARVVASRIACVQTVTTCIILYEQSESV